MHAREPPKRRAASITIRVLRVALCGGGGGGAEADAEQRSTDHVLQCHASTGCCEEATCVSIAVCVCRRLCAGVSVSVPESVNAVDCRTLEETRRTKRQHSTFLSAQPWVPEPDSPSHLAPNAATCTLRLFRGRAKPDFVLSRARGQCDIAPWCCAAAAPPLQLGPRPRTTPPQPYTVQTSPRRRACAAPRVCKTASPRALLARPNARARRPSRSS